MLKEIPWYLDALRCPECGAPLSGDAAFASKCSTCSFTPVEGTPLDLRGASSRRAIISMPRTPGAYLDGRFTDIKIERPVVTYQGPRGRRDASALLSVMMPHLLQTNIRILDLGCGPGDQKKPIEHLGWKYVGIDYFDKRADLLADAHCLPFRDETFSGVLSYSVLQHLYNPFIAVAEVHRVLAPKGVFAGSVAFGEPFQSSYFHMSPWGLLSILQTLGFRMLQIWPTYDTLLALARVGRYPRVIRGGLQLLEIMNRRLPFLAPRRMLVSAEERKINELLNSGGVMFLAQKS